MLEIRWIEPQRLAVAVSPTELPQLYALHAYGIRALLELGPEPLWASSADAMALLARLDLAPFQQPLARAAAPTLAQAAAIVRIRAACRHEQRPLLLCSPATQRAGLALWIMWLTEGHPPAQIRARLRAVFPAALRVTLPQRRLLRRLSAGVPRPPNS